MEQNKIVVFESKKIRRLWHNDEWYFSVEDVCRALTDSPDAGAYWRKLKQRHRKEGSEVVKFCHGLKRHLMVKNIKLTVPIQKLCLEYFKRVRPS